MKEALQKNYSEEEKHQKKPFPPARGTISSPSLHGHSCNVRINLQHQAEAIFLQDKKKETHKKLTSAQCTFMK